MDLQHAILNIEKRQYKRLAGFIVASLGALFASGAPNFYVYGFLINGFLLGGFIFLAGIMYFMMVD